MKSQTRASVVTAALVLATLVMGCSDEGERNPITPTLPQTPPAAQTPPVAQTPVPSAILYTLSGVVFEVTLAGNTPIAGVEVYCESCGPLGGAGHVLRQTDINGLFRFDGAEGVATGGVELLVAKPGYVLPNQPDRSGPDGLGWMGSVNVRLTGDTRHDIQITRK